MEAVLRAGLITVLLTTVFALAAGILVTVVSTLMYGGVRAAWQVAHGWRSVVCPPRDRTADVRLRSGEVTGCSLFGGDAPTCAHPCLLAGAQAK
jgi:hypothetical protein